MIDARMHTIGGLHAFQLPEELPRVWKQSKGYSIAAGEKLVTPWGWDKNTKKSNQVAQNADRRF